MPATVLRCTASGRAVALGRIGGVAGLREKAAAAFLREQDDQAVEGLCFAAVDAVAGPDDGEWVTVTGHRRLTAIESDADLVAVLSAGCEEILVHGGDGNAGGDAAAPAVGSAPISSCSFTLNGEAITVDNPDPRLTLLDYLRGVSGLTGTKGSCRQGGCGACTVMMEGLAINACLRPLVACDGHTITTTEGTGNARDGYSKVQAAIAEGNGSQCGFCTPGMVMNMHSLLATKKDLTPLELENHIDGNICRCTGYRPILASFKKLLAEGWRPACPGSCASEAAGPMVPKHFAGTGGTEWSEPLTLVDMCAAVSAAKASKTAYRIVAGNTGHGVYPDDKAILFLNAAKIPQLSATSGGSGAAITVGATTSINTLIDMLSSAKPSEAGGITTHEVLAKHLGKVANNQVRNVGSWAGNLALCHANPTFQSDIATIMTAAGASIGLADAKGALSQHTLTDFFAMAPADVTMIVSLTIPAASSSLLRTYKVMRRHQNAHAVVNAGFDFPSTSVSRPTADSEDGEGRLMVTAAPVLVWGGLKPFPTRATKTEAMLVGKNLATQATLKLALSSLESEFADITGKDVPYRKSLISSLFYKYWVEIMTLHNMPLPANQKSAGVPTDRPASTSTESYTAGVCDAIPKLASHRQAAGEAIYSDDNVPGVNALYASYVPSTVSCASISAIDATEALKMPGVVDFISAADLGPGSNFTQPVITPLKTVLGGRKIFADQDSANRVEQSRDTDDGDAAPGVQYFGQPLGIILADSREHAEYAAKHGVKATYTNIKKPVVTIDDAVAAGGSYVTSTKKSHKPPYAEVPIETVRGDCVAAEKAAAHCGEGVVYSSGQYHFHMETQTVVAVPMESDGLRLHCATQIPSSIQTAVAGAIGVSQNKVIIETKRCGGAFGGKLDNSVPGAVAVSFAAHKHRRECRMQLGIQDNMNTLGKRCPFKLSYKVCCDKDGKITAVSGTSYADNSGPPTDFAMAYGIANWDVKGVQCNTNTPRNTAMRAPTHLGEELFIETIIDHVATLVGKPAEDIRSLNLTKGPYHDEANYVALGMSPMPQLSAQDTLARPLTPTARHPLAAALGAGPAVPEELPAMFQAVTSNIAQLRKDCAEFNQANLWKKRGVAAVPTEYNCGWGGNTQHGAKIDVYPDGTLLVFVTGVEVGQGLFTKCAQVAAMTLGLPDTSLIEVQSVDTSLNPNGGGTGGSMTSGANAYGIQLACQSLLKAMAPTVTLLEQSQGKALTWQDKVKAAMAAGVDMSAKSWDHGMAVSGNGYAASVSVVEVDVLTGENQIISAELLYDCGKSLSPEIDLGQAEGAFMIGVGHFLTEGLEYDTTTGELLTHDTWEYKPPQCMDIPISWSTSFLANVENPTGFHGSKAIGEPPILMAAAVFFALKQAIYASRADAKMEGWVQLDAPASPAQVRQLLPSVTQLIG